MRESDLRKFIRKEIVLQEAAGDLTYADVKGIFDAFKNVFTVAGIAVKSVISALVLNVQVLFTLDPSKAKRAFEAYNTRLSRLTGEYREALAEADKLIDDFSPLLFVTNPAAYAAFHVADSYAGNFAGARSFLQDVGLGDDSRDWGGRDEGGTLQRILDQVAGKPGVAGDSSTLDRIQDEQVKIRKRLDALFGTRLSEGGLRNGQLNEAASQIEELNFADKIDMFLKETMPKAPPESFGIKSEDARAVLDLKRAEAEELAKILESPEKFMRLLGSAKTLEDVKAAVKELQGTPFVVAGLDNLSPQLLDSSASKAIKAAKEAKSLDGLIKTVGYAGKPDDEQALIAAVKAYQLKNLLGQTFLKSSDELAKGIEQLRSEFLQGFERDAPIATVSKVAPGSELEKIMKVGIEKIKSAGKRKSQA